MMFHAHDQAICTVLYGRKRWLIFDEHAQETYKLALNKRVSNTQLLDSVYKDDHAFRRQWQSIGWECVQEPGEMLFVPAHLYHADVNIGETVAMVRLLCHSSLVL